MGVMEGLIPLDSLISIQARLGRSNCGRFGAGEGRGGMGMGLRLGRGKGRKQRV